MAKRKLTEEHKKKIAASLAGRKRGHRPEKWKKKISEGVSRNWARRKRLASDSAPVRTISPDEWD